MKTQSSFSSFRNFASLAIQNVPSDDSDQTVKALADMNFHWGHMLEDTFSDWKLILFLYLQALAAAHNHDLSAALFANGWVYEKLGKECFVQNENK